MLRLTTKVAGLAGELGAQLVGGRAHLLDHLGPRLGEQRRQLLLAQRLAPAPLLDRPRRDVRGDRRARVRRPEPLPRDEAPVLELDHVEHALLHPLGIQVLRIDAEPLGQRVALRREVACGPGAGSGTAARARCGRRWPTARRGRWRPASTSSAHQSERFGGTWMPTSGISRRHSAISRFMSSSVIGVGPVGQRLRPSPVRRIAVRPPLRARPRRRSRRPRGRSSAGAGRSSGGSPPGCGRGARGPRPAPRARRPAPPRSRRCRPGSRS